MPISIARVVLVSSLLALGSLASSAAGEPTTGAAAQDSSRVITLPFLPAPRAGDPFAASKLTRRYGKNLAPILSGKAAPPQARPGDIEELERLAALAAGDTAAEADSIRLVQRRHATQLTPEERAKLVPKKPGVYVPIPSPVAAGTALLGGLVLLLKVISALAR